MEKENCKLIFSPPYCAHNDSKAGDSSESQRSIFSIVLEIIKDLRPGVDLLQYQVPVQLNVPKSHLQLYSEPLYYCNPDLLTACAQATTPLLRFLRVVAWHFSYNRSLPFCQAPFNPILGETHHVSFGSLNLISEQVSHHPPITAVYGTNEECGIRLRMWARPDAHFCGNRAETRFVGDKTLWLDHHEEQYDMSVPVLMTRLFPSPGNEWIGTSTVKCKSSGLEAIINYKSKPFLGLRGSAGHITGKIRNTFSKTVLFELSGQWNRAITLKDVKTGEANVLYDARSTFSSTRTIALRNQKAKLDSTESVLVWRTAMEALVRKDWEAAKAAKAEVEEKQRALAKIRKQEGKVWEHKHFVQVAGDGWHWKHVGQPVPEAPLVYHNYNHNHQHHVQHHHHHQYIPLQV